MYVKRYSRRRRALVRCAPLSILYIPPINVHNTHQRTHSPQPVRPTVDAPAACAVSKFLDPAPPPRARRTVRVCRIPHVALASRNAYPHRSESANYRREPRIASGRARRARSRSRHGRWIKAHLAQFKSLGTTPQCSVPPPKPPTQPPQRLITLRVCKQ